MQRRVLIAEEQAECCLLFKQFLERCGYVVSTAGDSDTCIRHLQDGPRPNVLVLSWELPPFGGQHVLNWLLDNGIKSLSVVAMTCGVSPDKSELSPDSPEVMFVQSPLKLLELLNAVQIQEAAPCDSWLTLKEIWKKSQPLPDSELGRLLPLSNTEPQSPSGNFRPSPRNLN